MNSVYRYRLSLDRSHCAPLTEVWIPDVIRSGCLLHSIRQTKNPSPAVPPEAVEVEPVAEGKDTGERV